MKIILNKKERMMLLLFLDIVKDDIEDEKIKNKINKNYKKILMDQKDEYYLVVIKFLFKDEILPLWKDDLKNIINNINYNLDIK